MSITPDCREISQAELDAIVIERDILRTKVQHLSEELTNEQRVVAGFRILLQDARDEVQRLEGVVTRLREIEVSEEVYGFMSAHGIDGHVLICGEFRSGREFKEKFKAHPRTPQVVEVPALPRSVLSNIDHHWPEDYGRQAEEITAWFRRHANLTLTPPLPESAKLTQFRQDYLALPHSTRNDALATHVDAVAMNQDEASNAKA